MILLQAKIPSGHALIDTGAQNAVIGQQDYNELKLRLAQQGLKPRELPGQGQCKGVGGVSKYVLTAEVPVSVAGIHGLLTTNVVGAPVPYLLPINFLKACGMVLDLEEMTCTWKSFGGLQSDISELVSGHLAIDMLDNISGWKNPHEQKGNVVLNESPLHQKFGKPKQSDFDVSRPSAKIPRFSTRASSQPRLKQESANLSQRIIGESSEDESCSSHAQG